MPTAIRWRTRGIRSLASYSLRKRPQLKRSRRSCPRSMPFSPRELEDASGTRHPRSRTFFSARSQSWCHLCRSLQLAEEIAENGVALDVAELSHEVAMGLMPPGAIRGQDGPRCEH